MDPPESSANVNSEVGKNIKWVLSKVRLNVIDNWEKRTTTEYSKAEGKSNYLRDLLELRKRQLPELRIQLQAEKQKYEAAYAKRETTRAKIKRINALKDDVEADIKAVVGAGQSRLNVEKYMGRINSEIESEVSTRLKNVESLSRQVDLTEKQIKNLGEELSKNSENRETLGSKLTQIKDLKKEVQTEIELIGRARSETENKLVEVIDSKKRLEQELTKLMAEERKERLDNVMDSRKRLEDRLKRLLEDESARKAGGGEAR